MFHHYLCFITVWVSSQFRFHCNLCSSKKIYLLNINVDPKFGNNCIETSKDFFMNPSYLRWHWFTDLVPIFDETETVSWINGQSLVFKRNKKKCIWVQKAVFNLHAYLRACVGFIKDLNTWQPQMLLKPIFFCRIWSG